MPELLIHFDRPDHFALALAALVFAYTTFSLVGFGTALIAAGPLAMLMPVARVIPLLALLDCIGASQRGWRARHAIALRELRRLLPGMLLGQWLGRHLDLRLSRPQLTRVLNALPLLAGVSLIWRHVAWP